MREFKIQHMNLHYFVGINQIKIKLERFIDTNNLYDEENALNQFFDVIREIQDKYKDSVVQFIKDKYLLNEDHIFTACYYLEKAFLQKKNVSNQKEIELLLYLATNRQINKSIKGFGIDFSYLKKNKLIYCIISPQNNIQNINIDLSRALLAEEDKITINAQSDIKLEEIRKYFKFSDNQLNSVLRSYGNKTYNSDLSISSKVSVIYDLICEKMALLSV